MKSTHRRSWGKCSFFRTHEHTVASRCAILASINDTSSRGGGARICGGVGRICLPLIHRQPLALALRMPIQYFLANARLACNSAKMTPLTVLSCSIARCPRSPMQVCAAPPHVVVTSSMKSQHVEGSLVRCRHSLLVAGRQIRKLFAMQHNYDCACTHIYNATHQIYFGWQSDDKFPTIALPPEIIVILSQFSGLCELQWRSQDVSTRGGGH